MQAKHSLEFARAPAVWSMYPKIMVSRKPSLVPDGGEVPRIESRLAQGHHRSQAPRAVFATSAARRPAPTLPIAYPHILAMPLHLAMLGAEAFPVKLFGLVHVQNRIAMREPLSADEPAEIRCWIEGHRDTERGQEFDLHTEYVVGGRAAAGTRPAPSSRASARQRARRRPRSVAQRRWRAGCRGDEVEQLSRALGARSPLRIHLRRRESDPHERPHRARLRFPAGHRPRHVVARAALASDFEAEQFNGGCELNVSFKLPIYMPAWLMLQRWQIENGSAFALRDAQGEKPHLTGTLKSLR